MVTLWSPNVQEPLVKMLCHKSAIKSLAIDQTGNYLVTSGLDHLMNIWDLRTFKQLRSVKISAGASSLAFSQKKFIAAGLRNEIVVFKNDLVNTGSNYDEESQEQLVEILSDKDVYLKSRLNNASIQNLQFCPFEDVLGVGHGTGISSLLVPGNYSLMLCSFVNI